MSSSTDLPVTIPVLSEATKEWLKTLPKKRPVNPGFPWTEELDQRLLAAWKLTSRADLAAALGCSPGTLLKRYRYLTQRSN